MTLRLVVTSDTHSKVDVSKIPDGDVFIHAGDLMTTGYLDEWKWATEWLAALPHKIKLFVPGNHDFHLQVYPGPALQDMRKAGVTVVGLPGNNDYATYVLPNGDKVLGLPFVTDLPRWAFNSDELSIYKYLEDFRGMNCNIVVSHAPVCRYLDYSHRSNQHEGIGVYREFLHHTSPKLWFHGHIHEGHGHVKVNQTDIYNVAMSDRLGQHANPPTVLDI